MITVGFEDYCYGDAYDDTMLPSQEIMRYRNVPYDRDMMVVEKLDDLCEFDPMVPQKFPYEDSEDMIMDVVGKR